MSFSVGSLVKARDREWVVVEKPDDELIVVRPLGGSVDEETGILTSLEEVSSATFSHPDPSKCGDFRSCKLLRDALRLGFRSSAGPFRSFGRLAFEPRPYQLVPLMMALKLDPVRLLIADDVGVGKTIQAALIARELLDRGEIRRLGVLCPPHLAEQWQLELSKKFHIEAELVLRSTVRKLEKECRTHESIFERYPFVVISLDYIKSDRRRDDFLRTAPELLIVDEAASCAKSELSSGSRHQRYQLLKGLAQDKTRHLVLLTATPHSGKDDSFRSLLGLLDEKFLEYPSDLRGSENETRRRDLAKHFIQRRRGDLLRYLETETTFPTREEREETYHLSSEYKKIFAKVVTFAKKSIEDARQKGRRAERISWWSALSLLRAFASSPQAALATLTQRSQLVELEQTEDIEEIGGRCAFDSGDLEDVGDVGDVLLGADCEEGDDSAKRRVLRALAKDVELIEPSKDTKLKKAVSLVKELLDDGYNPIIFCRFIATADYLAEQLRKSLPKKVTIDAVTGALPAEDREKRIEELGKAERRILVATDCLSEGLNLQEWFDSVVHYDLAWNPTRHEQREGRVDRFGQTRKVVRVLTVYGIDNQIDGLILDVLIRKHKRIQKSTGVAVPVPLNTKDVLEAVFEGLLLRSERASDPRMVLPGFEELMSNDSKFREKEEELEALWQRSAEREKTSQTMFAQRWAVDSAEEVSRALREIRERLGSRTDVEYFFCAALTSFGGLVSRNGCLKADLKETPRALRDALFPFSDDTLRVEFDLPTEYLYVHRTHPLVERLASFVVDIALDEEPFDLNGSRKAAARCGVIRTNAVSARTTILLLRYRFHIHKILRGGKGEGEKTTLSLLAEDWGVLGFEGPPQSAVWLQLEKVEGLLEAAPVGNVHPRDAQQFLDKISSGIALLQGEIDKSALDRAKDLLDGHERVREAARARGFYHKVEPEFPPDVLGVFICLPE